MMKIVNVRIVGHSLTNRKMSNSYGCKNGQYLRRVRRTDARGNTDLSLSRRRTKLNRRQ